LPWEGFQIANTQKETKTKKKGAYKQILAMAKSMRILRSPTNVLPSDSISFGHGYAGKDADKMW